MNYVFVRTKLQAVIARQLVEREYLSKPYRVIRLYQRDKEEDKDGGAYEAYQDLEKECDGCDYVIENDGLLKCTVKLIRVFIGAWRSGGNVYIATLNWYAVSLALLLMPRVNIISFDDGTANVEVRDNSYLSLKALDGRGLKRVISRKLFPQGAAAFNRKRVSLHYTIYKGLENIVNSERLRFLPIKWEDLLSEEETVLLPDGVRSILLGTVYEEMSDPERFQELARIMESNVDLYLPHPRENRVGVLCVRAVAESIISYYAASQRIKIFHFGSSVALAFRDHENTEFIDLSGSL